MKGAPQGGHKTNLPFLDMERYREGSLCLAGFMSEFWEGLGAGLTCLLLMPSRSSLPGQAVLIPTSSPLVQPLLYRADIRVGNNHSSAGTGLMIWLLLHDAWGLGGGRGVP